MAKKKKNSNYGGASAAKKAAAPEPRRSTIQYGLPGWAVVLCIALLGTALALQPGVDAPEWKNTVAYFLTGVPALVLAMGQRNVKQETGNKLAGVLMALFAFIGALYLVSAFTALGALVRA